MTGQLSDDFPVLLGPVRVETRFTDDELLIRVFPDDWSVETFEPRFGEAEIAAADAYWTARWTAGGRADALAAAWTELVGRVPAGRANWLLASRTPANPADEPTGVADDETVLVVVSAQPVAPTDRAPTSTYWTAVWRAHGDRGSLRQADTALVATVGASRATTIRTRRPSGVDSAALATGDEVRVAFLVLPPPADVAPQSWTRAARARLLPDRFQFLGYAGGDEVLNATGAPVPESLPVSPDPAATDQLTVDERTGHLHVPDELRWLTDFDRAVEVGMGIRVPLEERLSKGLDRLIVLGLREQSAPEQTSADLADLITRQLRSPGGYALLPQGTPTNNSEQAPAGQDETAEAAASLRSVGLSRAAMANDWTAVTDGQRFVDLLGLDPALLEGMPNADGTDQRDARAANTALWPATWGYFLGTALHPLVDPKTVEETRDFFLKHVSGRGPLPAVKIGRQPYGILPTTAFSKLDWPAEATHRHGLNRILSAAAADWHEASTKVAHLGASTSDVHQLLLDILAVHPTSAEFYQRYALSVEDVFNRENLGGRGHTVRPALASLNLAGPIRALLRRFGQVDEREPELLRRLFVDFQQPLLAPLVDDRPLSETTPIRPSTEDGRNYLRWLADLAGTDLDTIRLELGFAGDTPPATLLYFLLRHAVLLGWVDAARNLAVAAGVADPTELVTDPPFVHVHLPRPGESGRSESRFRRLYEPEPAITGDPDRLVVEYLPGVLREREATRRLAEQVDALAVLADLPTAKLERVLAEHLDLATYRLDAWRLGLVTERLAELRFGVDGESPAKRGLHVGAYGWLEDIRPRHVDLSPVELDGPLAEVFRGDEPLLHDPTNGGYIHAPSPAHARTAAVLRAGYLANGSPENPGAFAVNLSSQRVRAALTLLDGLRQGQSLGALLGYQLERGLHDRHEQAEVDSFISALRLRFPLRAGKIAETAPEPGQPVTIEQVEARNVVDGLALVRHVTRNDVPRTYPFGLDSELPPADPAQAAAITSEVLRLLDVNDALADLAIAEGAHQALAGNAERASATLDAYAKDGFPPDPAVVRTPRSGSTLTHRFGVRLRPGLSPDHGSPRSEAEPAVNDWLPDLLPSPSTVAALVTWTDPVDGDAHSRVVTQADLDLEPIELLWAVRRAGDAAMTDLDDRIVGFVIDHEHPRPDAELTIRYTERIPNKVTFFEVSPLAGALRSLLTTARPLRPSDLSPASGPAPVPRSADDAVSLPRQRPAAVRESLARLGDDVSDFVADLSALDPPEIVQNIDNILMGYAEFVGTAARFGMVRSGWSEVAAWRRTAYGDTLALVARTAARMTRALADADAQLARYDALPSATADPERFRRLRQIERLLTTHLTTPLPNRPNQYRSTVGNRRRDFDNRVRGLRQLAGTNKTTLSALLTEVASKGPLTDVDPAGLDLTPIRDRTIAYGRELLERSRALHDEITARLAAADAALAAYDQAVTGPDQVDAATDALKALLGEDVLAIPEYALPAALGDELSDARHASDDLVRHLTEPPFGREFPVDDWLHGVARVREKPRLWEQAVILADALTDGADDPELTPIQLPFRPGDHWLGLEFAPGAEIAEDRLLFTAHYASSGSDNTLCGLLLDEWTEVIPAERETTGLAVHIDRPDSEPPQAMLLVCPPVRTGAWHVDDLVAAVVETFDLARTRAVEPAHLDDTAYAHLLPATLMSATRQPITISTDLAIANQRWKASHE